MKKYLKNVYDAGTIAFHYTILYSLYSGLNKGQCIISIAHMMSQSQGRQWVGRLDNCPPRFRQLFSVYAPHRNDVNYQRRNYVKNIFQPIFVLCSVQSRYIGLSTQHSIVNPQNIQMHSAYTANFSPIKSAGDPHVAKRTL